MQGSKRSETVVVSSMNAAGGPARRVHTRRRQRGAVKSARAGENVGGPAQPAAVPRTGVRAVRRLSPRLLLALAVAVLLAQLMVTNARVVPDPASFRPVSTVADALALVPQYRDAPQGDDPDENVTVIEGENWSVTLPVMARMTGTGLPGIPLWTKKKDGMCAQFIDGTVELFDQTAPFLATPSCPSDGAAEWAMNPDGSWREAVEDVDYPEDW